VSGGDPRERFGALGAGDLHQAGPGGERPEEGNEGVLVLGEFVGVVGREQVRAFVLDQAQQFSPGYDIAIEVVAGKTNQSIRGRIPPDVPALDVDPEHQRIERARPGCHGRCQGRAGLKPTAARRYSTGIRRRRVGVHRGASRHFQYTIGQNG